MTCPKCGEEVRIFVNPYPKRRMKNIIVYRCQKCGYEIRKTICPFCGREF